MPFAAIDGARIHYEVTGSGHPVILLHGHSLDSRMWQEQAAILSDSYTVIRYDMRGHGSSEAPPSGYSRQHYTEELYKLIQHLDVTRPSVVGHSMGGSIALDYALTHPDRMSTLCLVGSGLEGFSYAESFSEVIAKQKALLRQEGVSEKFLRVAVISPLYEGIRRQPEKLALVRSMISTWSGASWKEETTYPTPPRLQIERLGDVRIPTLVVVGEKETRQFHDIADTLTRGIKVVRKAMVPEAGHLAPLENPEAFNDILLDFLGGAVGKALV